MTSSQPVFHESSDAPDRADADLDDLRAALEVSRHEAEALQGAVRRHERTARRETKRRVALERRLQLAERHAQELESSTSYRLGHALVLVAKSPVLFARWLAVRIVRFLARVLPEDLRAWIADRTPERWRAQVRRATRSRTTRSPPGTGAAPQAVGDADPGADEAERSGVLDSVRGRDPVLVFVLAPAADEDPSSVVDHVLTLRRAVGFVPVFITFSDDFGRFRERRVAFEYVPPLGDWVAHGMPGSWHALYDQRLEEIIESYDAQGVHVLPSRDESGGVADLLAGWLVRGQRSEATLSSSI